MIIETMPVPMLMITITIRSMVCGGVDHDSCGAKNWSTEMIIGSILAFVFLGIGIGIVYIYWKKKRITTAASSSSIEYAMDRPHAFA